jgi:Fe-S cluster assembly ATP-binding protein
MLSIQKLSVSIDGKKILKNLSIEIGDGEITVLMGPNGSGKSTLAHAIAGNPAFSVARGGKILFKGKSIAKLAPEERAKLGIFLSFQNPLPLPGVSVLDLLRIAREGAEDALSLRTRAKAYAKELGIEESLLFRSAHDGFSGGEKKKIEALQAGVLEPKLLILDEIDSGVDVDALRKISKFILKHKTKDASVLIITHATRILKYLKPDRVFVMQDGTIVRQGSSDLAREIEKRGFENISA